MIIKKIKSIKKGIKEFRNFRQKNPSHLLKKEKKIS